MQRHWLTGFVVFNVVLGTLSVASIRQYGSIKRAVAIWNGAVVQADEDIKVLEMSPSAKTARASFVLTNYGTRPVHLVGCSINCIGKMVEGLPTVLQPGQAQLVTFELVNIPAAQTADIHFRTNIMRQRTVSVQVVVRHES